MDGAYQIRSLSSDIAVIITLVVSERYISATSHTKFLYKNWLLHLQTDLTQRSHGKAIGIVEMCVKNMGKFMLNASNALAGQTLNSQVQNSQVQNSVQNYLLNSQVQNSQNFKRMTDKTYLCFFKTLICLTSCVQLST